MPAINDLVQHALDTVTEAREKLCPDATGGEGGDLTQARKFDRYMAAFPAILVSNGLGQAVAVLSKDAARSGASLGRLKNSLKEWLRQSVYEGSTEADLVVMVAGGTQDQYARATHEAMQWAGWVKKFSGALIAPHLPADTPEAD